MRISLEDLESYLWKSADLLRSHVDAASYKQYIFPLLFFKRLCDVWNEEGDSAVEFYHTEEARNFDEIHKFKIPSGYHWEDVRNVTIDLGRAIAEAFREIEKANPEKLQGIFGGSTWTNKNRLPDRLRLLKFKMMRLS